jgi:polar amino acid transport system substrate-binding protein
MLGYETEAELLSIPIDSLYKDPEARFLIRDEIRKHGFVKDKELSFLKKDGTAIWCSVTASAEYDEHGALKWINGFVEEITERKRLAEQLRQSQKMEAIGTLAGGIAHDFNNILTAIMGYATLCRANLTTKNTTSTYLENILQSSERAQQLTHSLLTFSRKQVISLQPVNLNEVVKRINTFLVRVIGEDIEYKTALCEEALVVMADRVQIEQILINLTANARDAMLHGGTLFIATERVDIQNEPRGSTLKKGRYAVLAVSDSGQGMNEAVKQRIFEPFFTTKAVGKGTGLGLSIVYGIIKQHAGEIFVYSEPGQGTTFKIYLPLNDTKTVHSDSPPLKKIVGGTETILVAEDDPVVRSLFKEVLEEFGYTVIEAVDGEDAVVKFTEYQEDIQLLLFDVLMPKKNGKQAYEEIKKMNETIKIIFSSGYTADIISHKGLSDDSTSLISKPIRPADLAAKIREILDS